MTHRRRSEQSRIEHRREARSTQGKRGADTPGPSSVARPWNFLAVSPGRRRALALAQKIVGADCPVLIMGPTGVGKDVLAEDIHLHSHRAGRPFIAVNCAALTPTLLESELFGHARGAYTSAVGPKVGLVELADQSTLFLDEVGELPLEAQVKLLRFLAKGSFWPVGAAKERSVDVRVIAATNRDLPAMLDGTFREDLFFRLSVVMILVPPLEPADTRLLGREFAAELARVHAAGERTPYLDAIAELASRSAWRGGARELRNAIERFFLLRDPNESTEENWHALATPIAPSRRSPLRATSVSPPSGAWVPTANPGVVLQHFEDLVFLAAAHEAGDVRELSRRLNRSLQTVYDRLRKLGIKPRDLARSEIVDGAMRKEREALLPYLPWIRDLLKDLLES